jgi:hypothetical protein
MQKAAVSKARSDDVKARMARVWHLRMSFLRCLTTFSSFARKREHGRKLNSGSLEKSCAGIVHCLLLIGRRLFEADDRQLD